MRATLSFDVVRYFRQKSGAKTCHGAEKISTPAESVNVKDIVAHVLPHYRLIIDKVHSRVGRYRRTVIMRLFACYVNCNSETRNRARPYDIISFLISISEVFIAAPIAAASAPSSEKRTSTADPAYM